MSAPVALTPLALTPLKLLQVVSNLPPPARTAPPNLERLAAGAPRPLDLDSLAALVGCEPELLARVSARRQALPAQLVGPVARELRLQAGEVRGAAGSVREGDDATALRPLPADRLLGEPLYPRPLSATVPPTFSGA